MNATPKLYRLDGIRAYARELEQRGWDARGITWALNLQYPYHFTHSGARLEMSWGHENQWTATVAELGRVAA